MKNSHIRKLLLATVAAGALSACATTSTTDDPVDPVDPIIVPTGPTTEAVVTTGTMSGDIGSNGMSFANGLGMDIEDLLPELEEGEWAEDAVPTVLTLRGAMISRTSFESEGTDDAITTALTDIELTLRPIYEEGSPVLQVIADIGTDAAVFTVDPDDFGGFGEFLSQSESEYMFGLLPIGEFTEDDSDLILVVAYGGSSDEGSFTETAVAAWLGQETSPDVIGAKANATYEGEFGLLLASPDAGLEGAIGGEMDMFADFAEGTVEGEMNAYDDTNIEITFDGSISGNGFAAAISAVESEDLDEAGFDFNGDIGQIDGVFYGVNGEEAAGTILVDSEVTDGVDTFDVDGGGVFYLQQDIDLH